MEDAITPHVKRSLNPFMLYCKAERSNVADTGFSQVTTINKELGRRWKALSDEERKPYIDEAKRLKAQHKKDFPDYKYLPRKKVKKDARPSVEKNERNSGPHASSTPYKVPSKSPKTSAVVKNLATGGSGMVPHPTYGSTLQAPGCTPNVYQTSGYQYQAAAPFYGLGNNQIAHGITEHQFQPPVPFQYQQQLCNYQPASLHNFDRSSSNGSASNDSVSGSSTPLGKAQAAQCFNIYSSFVNYQQPTDCGVEYHGLL